VFEWYTKNGAEPETDDFGTVTGVKITKQVAASWKKLDRIPGWESPGEFNNWFHQELNKLGLKHAEDRYIRLQSGNIPVGRGRTSALSDFERTFKRMAQDNLRQFGWSPKEDGPIPMDLDNAKALFIRLGASNPDYPNPEAYFDKFLSHVHNVAAQEAEFN
jgi:hypothetical protein